MKTAGAAIGVFAVSLVAATSLATASPSTTTTASPKNIVQTAVTAGQFKTLVSLVKQAGLVGALSDQAR